ACCTNTTDPARRAQTLGTASRRPWGAITMTRPHLLKPREEVRQLLRKQIEEANKVMPALIRSPAELKEAEERERQWDQYNFELLSRSFSTQEYAVDYVRSRGRVHRFEDDDHELAPYTEGLAKTIRDQIACLDSIINRLDLVPETAATGAKTIEVAAL